MIFSKTSVLKGLAWARMIRDSYVNSEEAGVDVSFTLQPKGEDLTED